MKLIKTEAIEKFLKNNNMSLYSFSKYCEINYNTLRNLMNGKSSGSFNTICVILEKTGIPAENLLFSNKEYRQLIKKK